MSSRSILRRSVNTERALTSPRPRLRGTSHLVAAVVAWPAVLTWIVTTPGGSARAAVTAFSLGIASMFTFSALLHLRRWDATTYERLFRLDHTGIYLAIAGTGAAVASLGLEGWPRRLVLLCLLGGAFLGIVLEWLPYAPPPGLNHGIYLTLGWVPILAVPWLWSTSGWVAVVWLAIGGVLYTGGAVIVGLRRPDPSPTWFGYHEIWHLCVIGAVAAHAVMIGILVERVS
jgi:hemolysin III